MKAPRCLIENHHDLKLAHILKAVSEHHIVRIDVFMYDAYFMKIFEAFEELVRNMGDSL
jgi:hypothetical protein